LYLPIKASFQRNEKQQQDSPLLLHRTDFSHASLFRHTLEIKGILAVERSSGHRLTHGTGRVEYVQISTAIKMLDPIPHGLLQLSPDILPGSGEEKKLHCRKRQCNPNQDFEALNDFLPRLGSKSDAAGISLYLSVRYTTRKPPHYRFLIRISLYYSNELLR
jgi:hypothetical protein